MSHRILHRSLYPMIFLSLLLVMAPLVSADVDPLSHTPTDAQSKQDEEHSPKETTSSPLLISGRLAELDHEIISVYFLLETKLGVLKIFKADKMYLGQKLRQDSKGYRYYLTAVFPKSDVGANSALVRSSFVAIVGNDISSRVVLPIVVSNFWDLEAQSRNEGFYKDSNEQLHEELEQRRNTLINLRREAEQIAGRVGDSPLVKQASDLKREVGALSFAQEDLEVRLKMLQGMISGNDDSTTPESFDGRQAELSEQLRDVAQLTARADRMNRLRKLAYANSIKRKYAIIEEFGNVDPEDLQTELNELRKQRAKLEAKLNEPGEKLAGDNN